MGKNSGFIIAFIVLLSSCTSGDDTTTSTTLADLVATNTTILDNVIACASGSENEDEIIAYVYPRPGVTALRYFETNDVSVDKNDFTAYTEVVLESEDFFNGYLMKFTRQTSRERWVILTFIEEGVLQLSNPILLKHKSQNTAFTQEVVVDQTDSEMPVFSWNASDQGEDAIYFQVLANDQNDLQSGTYTFDTHFQYYNLDNVVLNITRDQPADLVFGTNYSFTLMGVSEDNWVNTLDVVSFISGN